MDIFERLKNKCCCNYISDLRFEPANSMAINALKRMNISDVSLHELSDLAEYLCDKKINFKSIECARDFFEQS